MKIANKFSSLIGSLIIAFAITLFLPSTVNAKGHGSHGSKGHSSYNTGKNSHGSHGSWGNHGSHGSKGHNSCNTGKNSHGSHGSWGNHGSHGSKGKNSHGSHGSWGNHGSHGSKGKNSHGSHGSWGKNSHGSHGSWGNHNSNCDKYRTLAYKYLNAYYRCYNYTYYRYYVYFIKKYNQCKASTPTTTNCDKYKNLAQRYLNAYYRCGNYCYYQYYVYYMQQYNKCQANTIQTGKVCGLVFEDSNDNGKFDKKSDKRLANVTVKITDSKGKVHTVKTNAKGYYCARKIATGTASVDIDESTLPANPTQVVGTPVTEVNVKANRKNWEECNGYIFPTPTGNVCGTVYEDKNDNHAQDAGEIGEAGIKVTIIDANGDSHEVTTDAQGNYCLKNVVEGSASVTLDVTTLPDGATHTAGNVTDDINVIANQNNPAGEDGYTLPTPTGNVCGTVYEDKNANNTQDAGEKGTEGIKVTILDANGDSHEVITDAQGNYCLKDVVEGSATITVDSDSLPAYAQLTDADTNPSTITVKANQNNPAGDDGYILVIPIGNICGQVIVDGDDQANVSLVVSDAFGVEHIVTTNNRGKWCANNIPEGDVIVDVDESTLPDNVTRVLGEDQDAFTVIANETADAGIDGYVTTPTGSVCGAVYVDVNKNGRQDYGELGIPNITITITDANNNITTVETGTDGKYCTAGISEGEATVDVDENDPDMPAGSEKTINPDPSTVNVVANKNNNAGIDGYYNPNTGLGCVCTLIYMDNDKDGTYSYASGDRGIKHVTVTLVDSQGTTHQLETDNYGYIFAVLPLGEVTLTVDENDVDMPTNVTLKEGAGMNPISFENTMGPSRPTHYGYVTN